MPRFALRAAALTTVLTAWTATDLHAQTPAAAARRMPRPVQANGYYRMAQAGPAAPTDVGSATVAAAGAPTEDAIGPLPGYPYLDAPLYPTPQPGIPPQVGSTLITNQAFAPHEMLHSHDYHAMYPPFYWKVHGSWMTTPWGVWSHDHWKLEGTHVKVKYRSHVPLHALWLPPATKNWNHW